MPGLEAFGRIGYWLSRGAFTSGELGPVAARIEREGFGAIWISGGAGPGVFDAVAEALDATESVPVATGVMNLWAEDAATAAAAWNDLERRHPGRFLLGLGVSHAPLVHGKGLGEYRRPLERTTSYLDDLDAAPTPVPRERRLLGALGPAMLELARERTLGSHPYLVTPEHTAVAREVLGDGALAPEQTVVLHPDWDEAMRLARDFLATYLSLPNYTRNWLRLGFTEADLAGGGSDRLAEALIAIGPEAVRRSVDGHLAAGADHVCLQAVIGPAAGPVAWDRAIAELAEIVQDVRHN